MNENSSSRVETTNATPEVIKKEKAVDVSKVESYPSRVSTECSSTPIKVEQEPANKEELKALDLGQEVKHLTESTAKVPPKTAAAIPSDVPLVRSPVHSQSNNYSAEMEHFITKLIDGEEVHIAAKAPRRNMKNLALTQSNNASENNDLSVSKPFHSLTETPKTTLSMNSRCLQAASQVSESLEITPNETSADDLEYVDCSVVKVITTKKRSELDVTPRITRSMVTASNVTETYGRCAKGSLLSEGSLSTLSNSARIVRATSPRITRSQTAAKKLTNAVESEQRVLRPRNRQLSENIVSSLRHIDDDFSNMGDDEADQDAVRLGDSRSKPHVTSSRRRKRKIITMKKCRRKSSANSLFGSPLRRRIVVDDWVRDGQGRYSKEAVLLYEKVQLEAEKLRQQKLSANGCIDTVNLGGRYEIKTSYCGNYPAEYSTLKTLYVCDGCFAYFSQQESQYHHMKKCSYRFAPPGNEIYCDLDKEVSVFEVHGKNDAMYCSNLCRLTMLWLENKVIFMDVEPFDFYVLTTFRNGGFCSLGYFSKQSSYMKHNLSCFCVFPCYQGKGYGTFLIDFSYMISRIDGEPSGPERPFSQSGMLVYKKYWCNTLIRYIYIRTLEVGWENLRLSLEEMSCDTGIEEKDIVESLTDLCGFEWTRNCRSLVLNISEQSIMEIGKCVAENSAKKLLAKVDCLTPLFEQGVHSNPLC